MYSQQHDPELERLRSLQASVEVAPSHPEAPTWNFHTLNRAGSIFGILLSGWMFLTFLARLVPDFAFIYGILIAAGLLACIYVALAGHPSLFALVAITAFGVTVATLLAGWDFLLGIFYYQYSALPKLLLVVVGFLISTALLRIFFNVRTMSRPQNQEQEVKEPSSENSAYDAAWASYLDQEGL